MKINFDIALILQGVAIILISGAVYGIISLNEKVAEVNGSIREIKVEQIQHSRLDDERFEDTRTRISDMWDVMNKGE